MNRVLVVGDVMLDEFVYGDVHRISPEAATPVLSVKRVERMVGGAGNVARGIAALDCMVDLVSIVGDDDAGRKLIRELHSTVPHSPWLIISTERTTTHKQRFVSDQHSAHLLRVDTEDAAPVDDILERSILRRATTCLQECNLLVLSDYNKGIITPKIANGLIAVAKLQEKPIIVDSKRSDLSMFNGATIVKVNLCELGFCYDEPDMCTIARAAYQLADQHVFETVVVTRGESGLAAFSYGRSPIIIPGKPVRVRDVSGAGDTVVATLATLLAGGVALPDALERANTAAAIAVSKPGTAVVSLAELRGGAKVALDWSLVDQRVKEWRGKKIGFVNGCFDLLHTGHLHLLSAARADCDRLIVGINSDESVRALKGPCRPVRTQAQRAEVLAALTDLVDLVVVFGDDPTSLVERVRPDIMFVGDDYTIDQVKGQQFSKAVRIIPRLADVSTTGTIERLQIRDGDNVIYDSGPRNDPNLLKPFVPTGPAVERDKAVKEGCRYCDGDCTGACLNVHGRLGDDYCGQCHGPCLRRPRHGEMNL